MNDVRYQNTIFLYKGLIAGIQSVVKWSLWDKNILLISFWYILPKVNNKYIIVIISLFWYIYKEVYKIYIQQLIEVIEGFFLCKYVWNRNKRLYELNCNYDYHYQKIKESIWLILFVNNIFVCLWKIITKQKYNAWEEKWKKKRYINHNNHDDDDDKKRYINHNKHDDYYDDDDDDDNTTFGNTDNNK